MISSTLATMDREKKEDPVYADHEIDGRQKKEGRE